MVYQLLIIFVVFTLVYILIWNFSSFDNHLQLPSKFPNKKIDVKNGWPETINLKEARFASINLS